MTLFEKPIETEPICSVCGIETGNVYTVTEWMEYEREVNHAHFTEQEEITLTKYGPANDLCAKCWERTRKRMINR